MYLWAFLITAAAGLVAGVVAIAVGEWLLRRRRGSAIGLRWACFGTGTLGAFLLVGGFMFPQLRGRTPPQDGVAFTPNPFTDPFVECSRKNGGVVYAASSWMSLNPSSYSCGVK